MVYRIALKTTDFQEKVGLLLGLPYLKTKLLITLIGKILHIVK
jgi:hypothetical protein